MWVRQGDDESSHVTVDERRGVFWSNDESACSLETFSVQNIAEVVRAGEIKIIDNK